MCIWGQGGLLVLLWWTVGGLPVATTSYSGHHMTGPPANSPPLQYWAPYRMTRKISHQPTTIKKSINKSVNQSVNKEIINNSFSFYSAFQGTQGHCKKVGDNRRGHMLNIWSGKARGKDALWAVTWNCLELGNYTWHIWCHLFWQEKRQ